ncbi:MAG: FAD-binding oxidoreductase, partial [Alphaproteobacteria bacterium]
AYPPDPASFRDNSIGGNLATNAGGVQVMRYGMARDLCLGLEAVLADGSVLHGLSRLRKDNTGYDLRHLLIGSEGTLGVITAAALRLFPRPRAHATAVLAVPDPAAALALLACAREALDDRVSAFELIGAQGYAFMAECFPAKRRPLDPVPPWSVLIEAAGHDGNALQAAFARFIEQAMARGQVTDGVIAASEAQRRDIWAFRETIPEANRRIGAIASHDISLPLSEIPGFLDAAPAALEAIADVRINCFGHLGDGNLHYNLFPAPGRSRADYAACAEALGECVIEMVLARGGSFSAEHGVGRLRRQTLARHGDPTRLAAMRALKAALDPQGILNPGAVLAP